jgi:hypothetical protein
MTFDFTKPISISAQIQAQARQRPSRLGMYAPNSQIQMN